MSAQTLETIQAKRLAFLKVLKPVAPLEKTELVISTDAGDDDGEKDKAGGLPPPASEADVINIAGLYKANEQYLTPARDKLAKGDLCVEMKSFYCWC